MITGTLAVAEAQTQDTALKGVTLVKCMLQCKAHRAA